MRNIPPNRLFYILVSCKLYWNENWKVIIHYAYLIFSLYIPKSNVLDPVGCQILLLFPLVFVYYFLLSSSQKLSIANSSSAGQGLHDYFLFFSLLKFFMAWACAGLVYGVTTFVNVSTYSFSMFLFHENMAFLFATSRF